MDKSKFDEYLSGRYADQVKWYGDSAKKNKIRYTIFQWGVIILSASLPVLIAKLPADLKWATIAFSILLAIGTTAQKTFKFQENWINYRTIAETLKKEKFFYDAEIDEYGDVVNKESLFVDRVETLISRENSLWVTTHTQKDEEHEKK